jgi:purine-binding chemotaxis protein CheW
VFGLDIMAIREIRAWTPITRLPRVPHYVAGVVNLRGAVLPIIDLAARLGWEPTEATPRHAIVVTQTDGQARGLIVEAVRDIVTITSESLQPPPASADGSIVSFIEGLAATDERMVMILNLQAVSSGDQLAEAA